MKIWVKELKKLLSEINEEARKYKKNIVTIYAISILLSVITIYNSLLNKLVIDEVFYKKNINYLYENFSDLSASYEYSRLCCYGN